MDRHFPDNIMNALKDAAVKVFWTKRELRALFQRCDVPTELVTSQDWNAYKFFVVDPVLETLNTSPQGVGPLRRILAETLTYVDGNHLLRFPDGQKKKREAERCLSHLRLLVEAHDTKVKSEQEEQAKRRREAEEQKSKQIFYRQLADLKGRFTKLQAQSDRQARGYELEQILYKLFELFDLEPRGPFRIKGEQIDGAFIHDGDEFLLEAKWQQSPVGLSELRDLDGAVASNLDNTLGLFISVNGFSEDGLERYRQGNRPRIICMDGMDLTSVLEGFIDLRDLLRRKRAVAAQQGRIFIRVDEIMRGEF